MAKCNEILRLLKDDGWYTQRRGKGSHIILNHPTKKGVIVFPDHGSQELGKGLEQKILKRAGIKRK